MSSDAWTELRRLAAIAIEHEANRHLGDELNGYDEAADLDGLIAAMSKIKAIIIAAHRYRLTEIGTWKYLHRLTQHADELASAALDQPEHLRSGEAFNEAMYAINHAIMDLDPPPIVAMITEVQP